MTLSDKFNKVAKWVSDMLGKPLTFFLAMAAILIWAVIGPLVGFSELWQLSVNTGTTIVTFLMIFLVQNTQNRDNAALHVKLDMIILALDKADNKAINLQEKSQEEVEEIEQELEENE